MASRRVKKGGKSNAHSFEIELPSAIRSNDLSAVKDVVHNIQKFHHKRKYKALAIALWQACDRDCYEIAEFLLQSGVDANVQIKGGSTPLMASASRAIVKLLLEHNANVDSADDLGRTALMFAKNSGVVEGLLRGGATLALTDNRGRTALIHAATSEPSGEVAICLLNNGADPTIRDDQEQNALILASLTGKLSVVRESFRRGATVGPADTRGRNILHHLCESEKAGMRSQSLQTSVARTVDLDILDAVLKQSNEDDVDARDFEGKTPLHLAVARNNLPFVKLLLENGHCKANVNAGDKRKRTALHTTANNDRGDIAHLLLSHGAKVNAATDVGLTALHAAACRNSDTRHTACVLLEHNADTNLVTENGRSALHFAAQSGNVEVLNLLLDQDDIQITARDKSGKTPLDYAFSISNSKVVTILSEYGSKVLSDRQIAESKDHIASVINFTSTKSHAPTNFGGLERQLVKVVSLLNGTFRMQATPSESRSEQFMYTRKNFKWIHLPAKNLAWCKEILLRWFRESSPADVEGYKRLQMSLKREHSGREPHSHYMKPTCEGMANHQNMGVSREGTTDSDPGESSFLSVDSNLWKGRRRTGSNPSITVPGSSLQSSSKMIYLFMPYVHWESARSQELRQKTVEQALILKSRNRTFQGPAHNAQPRPTLTRTVTRNQAEFDASLIKAHLELTPCTLHIRRTLGQFSNPSTKISANQHQEQVVFRYQDSPNGPEDPYILMVDQLWMWIVNDDLVITSFPRQWGEPISPPNRHNVLEDIITEVKSPDQEGRILSVYELAIIIADRCFSTYEVRDETGQSYLDVFKITIDEVTTGEKEISARFEKASRDASAWLDHPGSPKPASIQKNLLEIVTESQDLLQRIREVRNELKILNDIFSQQSKVLAEMARHILNVLKNNQAPSINRKKVETMLLEQKARAGNLIADIEYLDKQAERITGSIKDVLDLKESFVSALQVADSSNQNQALMVFTIVTVVFSPLSFLTSFFALNIREWHHNSQGNTEFSLHYIERYVFGVGFAIAVPCVIYALTLNRLSYWGRKWSEFFRRHFPALSNKTQGGKRPSPVVDSRVPTWTSITSTDLEKG